MAGVAGADDDEAEDDEAAAGVAYASSRKIELMRESGGGEDLKPRPDFWMLGPTWRDIPMPTPPAAAVEPTSNVAREWNFRILSQLRS